MATYNITLTSTWTAIDNALNANNTDPSKYAEAYSAILNDLETQNLNAQNAGLPPVVDADTLTWFTYAPQINDPASTTYNHYFERFYLEDYVQAENGTTVSDAQFQSASNNLANQILSAIQLNNSIPDFSVLGPQDTQNIAEEFFTNPRAFSS